jgi:hypothetical protein
MGQVATSTLTFVGYHGTSSVHVPAIRAGIRPRTGLNFAGGSQLGAGFYVTGDAVTAQRFAEFAVAIVGGVPVVLDVYARAFDQMQGTVVPAGEWWRINPRYITDFDYLTAPITSFEPAMQIKFNPRAYGALEVR